MKTIILIQGNIHSGKTIIFKILNNININIYMNYAFYNFSEIYFFLKNTLKIKDLKNINECLNSISNYFYEYNETFKNYNITIENFDFFFTKAKKYSNIKILATELYYLKHFNIKDLEIKYIFIFRDPRISWLLNVHFKKNKIKIFTDKYKKEFNNYLKLQKNSKLIIFERFVKNFPKTFYETFNNILNLHDLKYNLELPSPRYNCFINEIDLKEIKYQINRTGIIDEFKIIETELNDEMKFLGYTYKIEINKIIEENYEISY